MTKEAAETHFVKLQGFANDAVGTIIGMDEVLLSLIRAGEVTPDSLKILRDSIALLKRDHPDYL